MEGSNTLLLFGGVYMKFLRRFNVLVVTIAVLLVVATSYYVRANWLYTIPIIPTGTIVPPSTFQGQVTTGGTFITSISPGGGGSTYLDHCTYPTFHFIVGNLTSAALTLTVQTSSDASNWVTYATSTIVTSTSSNYVNPTTVGTMMHQYVRGVLTPAASGTSFNTTVTMTCRD